MANKTLEEYLKMPYIVEATPDADGTWFARMLGLRGCMTQANSWNELMPMIYDAKKLWLETMMEMENFSLPAPSQPDNNQTFDVVLWKTGRNIVITMHIIRAYAPHLSLGSVKDIVDNLLLDIPFTVLHNINFTKALEVRESLSREDGIAEIVQIEPAD